MIFDKNALLEKLDFSSFVYVFSVDNNTSTEINGKEIKIKYNRRKTPTILPTKHGINGDIVIADLNLYFEEYLFANSEGIINESEIHEILDKKSLLYYLPSRYKHSNHLRLDESNNVIYSNYLQYGYVIDMNHMEKMNIYFAYNGSDCPPMLIGGIGGNFGVIHNYIINTFGESINSIKKIDLGDFSNNVLK